MDLKLSFHPLSRQQNIPVTVDSKFSVKGAETKPNQLRTELWEWKVCYVLDFVQEVDRVTKLCKESLSWRGLIFS